MFSKLRLYLIAFAIVSVHCQAGQPELSDKALEKGMAAIGRGAQYLLSKQNADGSWGKMKHPAIAALCVMAIHDAPGVDAKKRDEAINKGLKYVLGFVQKDGSIFPASTHKKHPDLSAFYPNYTTSIVLLCLATVDRIEYVPIMRKARAYLKSTQFRDAAAVDYGGIGYGKTKRADVSNTGFAAEALYYTEYLDHEPYSKDSKVQKQNSESWTAMTEFLTKVQNLESNKQPYVSKDPKDEGGFFYRPFESKAGSRDEKDETKSLVSSGSMTYAGLKSMLYAKLKPTDPRVKGAMKYLMTNYVLDENPGQGKEGLYFYLYVMTRALHVFGQETLVDSKGNKHKWREDVAAELLKLQKKDGSWVNENGRFFESNPTLVTTYATIALKTVCGRSKLKAPQK